MLWREAPVSSRYATRDNGSSGGRAVRTGDKQVCPFAPAFMPSDFRFKYNSIAEKKCDCHGNPKFHESCFATAATKKHLALVPNLTVLLCLFWEKISPFCELLESFVRTNSRAVCSKCRRKLTRANGDLAVGWHHLITA